MTMLSPNFSLAELTRTQVRLPNAPGQAEQANLVRLCNDVLEPIALLGVPLIISSGYRSPEVNARVGGSKSPLSAHCDGRAADFEPAGYELARAVDAIAASEVPFDKLLAEGVAGRFWIHVQVARPGAIARRMVLMTRDGSLFVPWDSNAFRVSDPDSGSSIRA